MNSTLSSVNYRPQLRTNIIFGPPELSRGTIIYYMKDEYTQWFYRIGAREYFLASRMDGSRTLDEIGTEYEAAFGRRLNSRSWAGLFKLLAARKLLADDTGEAELEELKHEAARRKKTDGNGLLHRRFKLVNPDALLAKIHPWSTLPFTLPSSRQCWPCCSPLKYSYC